MESLVSSNPNIHSGSPNTHDGDAPRIHSEVTPRERITSVPSKPQPTPLPIPTAGSYGIASERKAAANAGKIQTLGESE